MKALNVRYKLQAGPFCFVPDLRSDDMFRAPGGIQMSERQIAQLANRQKWRVIKVHMVIEREDFSFPDLENA